MAGSDVVIRVVGDAKQFDKTMDKVETRADRVADKMSASGKKLTRGLTLPILGAGIAAIALAGKQEEAEAKITSTFESMSAASWTTVAALKAQASAFQEVSTFGDEAVLGFQDVLLTFGNVKDVVGEGNDIFQRATQTGLDLSAALGGDLQSSAILLGKALNDPIAGISAMSRVGVSFTEDQKDMIKTLVEAGDTLGAQKIIMAALEDQFEGTAQAVADTSQGQLKQAMNALGDSAESFGAILLPVVVQLADGLKKLAGVFTNLSPEAKKVVTVVLGLAATIGPLLIVGAKMVKMFGAVSKAFGVLTKVMAANPWVLLAIAVVAIGVLIFKNWDKIVAFLTAVWDTLKDAATVTWNWIKNVFQNVADFLVGLFLNFTPLGRLIKHWDDVKAVAIRVWELVSDSFGKIVNFLVSAFSNFTPLGLLIKHWDTVKEAASKTWEWIRDKFDAVVSFFAGIPGRITALAGGMFKGIANAFSSMINFLIKAWNDLSFTFPSFTLPGALGGATVGGFTIDTPNIPLIPSFHAGGVFRAPGGGDGLALLQDGETVLPRGAAGGVTVNVYGFVGSEARLAEQIDRILTRRLRRGALGFVS